MKRKCIAVITASTLAAICSSIPAAAAPARLTLRQAEQTALTNHPQIFAAQDQALASNQVVREARSNYFPLVTANITGVDADRNTRIGAGYLQASQLFSREAQGITVDQIITDSGRTQNLVASSRFGAQAANETTRAVREDVLYRVNQAYFEVLRDQALLKVAQHTVNERQVVYDQVSALVKNKLKSNLDLSFANVNLQEAKLLQIQAQNNLKSARAQLTRAMGLQRSPPYVLVEQPMPSAPPPGPEPLVAEAMQKRPEIIAEQDTDESAYKFERAERDLSFPTVLAEGDAGYTSTIAQLTLPRVIPDHYEAAAINVEVPVFNGHLFAARREAALLREHAASENLRDIEERIARDVRVAWASAVTSYQQIGVADELLNQAKLSLALAQGRYNVGLGSIVELSQAQLNETQAAIQDVNARYDFQDRYAALQYQVGILD
jgi:outer membrane protein